jgi:hypothetical protein
MTYRVVLALSVVMVDLVVFFVPLTALFLAYVILFNPPWFRAFLDQLGSRDKGV